MGFAEARRKGRRGPTTNLHANPAKEFPMGSLLANLFGARRRPSTAFRPGLEALEARQMLNGSPLAADADRSLTTPTGYTWYHGVDAAFLTSKINQQHARIIDLEAEPSPDRR
jgi:hypothetical protein